MNTASTALAHFARHLAFESIPREVIERAKACMIDTIGAAYYGSTLPWSRIIFDYARRTSRPGDASVIGTGVKLQTPFAAMVNGAFAHAFELDSMCQPSVGAHPGASLTAPGLAVAQVFCRDPDLTRLSAGLGEEWHTLRTTLKAYACHSTAHVAVTSALELKSKHGIAGDDIESIRVAGSDKLVSHHSIHEPHDIAMSQYSGPFSVALAFYRDPRDPTVFCEESLGDPAIRSLCRRTVLEPHEEAPKNNKLASKVTLLLKNGRQLVQALEYFPGMPQRPLSSGQLWDKFHTLTAALPPNRARSLFDKFLALEGVADVAQLEMI